MHSDRIPESTKQWLQNEDFILWCLVPTQESEEWWVNYQKDEVHKRYKKWRKKA